MDELLKAFKELADTVKANTEVVRTFVEGQQQQKGNMSVEELQIENPITKVTTFTVQRMEKVSGQETWHDEKTFTHKKLAQEFILGMKKPGRIIVKAKYLSSNDVNDGEPKGESDGQSLDVQGTEKLINATVQSIQDQGQGTETDFE